MNVRLTKQDLERLLTDPSAANRADTAAKIADDFQFGDLSDSERRLALDIFAVMVEDAERRVRMALAEHLKECSDIPHDLALRLAQDEDAVAEPILRFSELLTDDDLIAIIRASGETKQTAIADRRHVSSAVTEQLVERGTAAVVARVMGNPGAEFSEATYGRALERHGDDPAVSGAMARRGLLPVSVAERLVALATDKLERQLVAETDESADLLSDLIVQVRERATLSLVDPRFGIGDARQLVQSLAQRRRLTPSIIVRGLCMGDLAFFEAAMSHITKLPLLNIRMLSHDEGRRGLHALWIKAGMPLSLLPVVTAAMQIADDTEYDGEPHDRERYRRRVIQRVLTLCEGAGIDLAGIDSGSLDYLLTKLAEFEPEGTLRAS